MIKFYTNKNNLTVPASEVYINYNNQTLLLPSAPSAPALVSWATGTDEEIAAMINGYYDGTLSLEDIKSVWSVGDARKIHLNAMAMPSPYSSQTLAAQDLTFVITDFDHNDLATSVGGKTKACITVQARECIGALGYLNGQDGSIYANGDSSLDTTFTKWSDLYMRTYLNNTVLGAIPSGDFKTAIKQSKHYRHTTYNGSTSEEVTDTLFLPSYPEIFGTASNSYYVATSPVEGTQWSYYTIAANRNKYGNNNGSPNSTKAYWWEGSASSNYYSSYGYRWCFVSNNGTFGSSGGTAANGLAPAFVM